MWWAPLAAAGGQAASSLIPRLMDGDNNSKWPERFAERQFSYAQRADANRIRWAVADAKAAGLHPLAALGASAGGGSFAMPVQSSGSSWSAGDAVGSALDTLSRGAGQAFTNRYEDKQGRINASRAEAERQRQLARQEALDAANIQEVRSRTALNHARLRSLSGPPAISSDLVVGDYPNRTGIGPDGRFHIGSGADAEDIARLYGEIAGEAYGLTKLLDDSYTVPFRARPDAPARPPFGSWR